MKKKQPSRTDGWTKSNKKASLLKKEIELPYNLCVR